jgi:hypothetical protein
MTLSEKGKGGVALVGHHTIGNPSTLDGSNPGRCLLDIVNGAGPVLSSTIPDATQRP